MQVLASLRATKFVQSAQLFEVVHTQTDSEWEKLKRTHGHRWAFHGSSAENFHSILQNGLRTMSGSRWVHFYILWGGDHKPSIELIDLCVMLLWLVVQLDFGCWMAWMIFEWEEKKCDHLNTEFHHSLMKNGQIMGSGIYLTDNLIVSLHCFIKDYCLLILHYCWLFSHRSQNHIHPRQWDGTNVLSQKISAALFFAKSFPIKMYASNFQFDAAPNATKKNTTNIFVVL
jgi:hypothetical protein